VIRYLVIFALVLLAIGAAALYLLPLLWQPEPVLVFKVGIGAGVFAILFFIAVLLLIIAAAGDWGREHAAREVTREREESHRQFLQRLDHELKNPLTGLQAALTNLREAEDREDIHQAVENASQAASRIGRILRDLRKLSELEVQMLEHRPLDVGQLVGEMVSAACSIPAHRGREIKLLVSQVPSLPLVTGDRDMLGLAFYNLIDNALKFTSPDDAIEVRVHEDGRSLFIEVADGGAGIPPQEHQRIFEDLYRGENARETEGSGLGLALVRRIIHLHGGEISLRSNPAQGRGTVFIIRLPVEKKWGVSPNSDRMMTGL
jgi:two-component system OmpR family sensor kinase